MASPAFIYAFDNLGPQKFVELCGLLLGSRFRGFLISSPGSDAGVDAEVAPFLGEFRSDTSSLVIDTLIPPNKLTVFQFKHKVVGRVGEANARTQLLNAYKSTDRRKSEVLGNGVIERDPDNYVLVTNVEVNSIFRQSFINLCKQENSAIANYQVIGLDELESWVIEDRNLRAEYFPTMFGPPRFDLKLKLRLGTLYEPISVMQWNAGVTVSPTENILCLTVMNIGIANSYVQNISFKTLINGEIRNFMQSPVPSQANDPLLNPKIGEAIEPGKNQEFRFRFELFKDIKREANTSDYFLAEVCVLDQIDNFYSIAISDLIRRTILESE
jgi:hypothetical protein